LKQGENKTLNYPQTGVTATEVMKSFSVYSNKAYQYFLFCSPNASHFADEKSIVSIMGTK
jgi:hypothetical protein